MKLEEGPAYRARRAREIFFRIEGLLLDLDRDLARVGVQLADLLEEYRETLAGGRLILKPRMKAGDPHPQNLTWAVLTGAAPETPGRASGRKISVRLSGKLTAGHVYRYAGRHADRARYFEIDRRRTSLNVAHVALAETRARVAKFLIPKFTVPGVPEGMGGVLASALSRRPPPRVRALLIPALHLADRVAFAEGELRELAEEYRRNPACPDLALEFEQNNRHRPCARTRWRHPVYGRRETPLTDRAMRGERNGDGEGKPCVPWTFPTPVRRAISAWELRRRRLSRHRAAAQAPFESICEHIRGTCNRAWRMLGREGKDGSLPIDPPGPASDSDPQDGERVRQLAVHVNPQEPCGQRGGDGRPGVRAGNERRVQPVDRDENHPVFPVSRGRSGHQAPDDQRERGDPLADQESPVAGFVDH
jgi:hypothetical protein